MENNTQYSVISKDTTKSKQDVLFTGTKLKCEYFAKKSMRNKDYNFKIKIVKDSDTKGKVVNNEFLNSLNRDLTPITTYVNNTLMAKVKELSKHILENEHTINKTEKLKGIIITDGYRKPKIINILKGDEIIKSFRITTNAPNNNYINEGSVYDITDIVEVEPHKHKIIKHNPLKEWSKPVIKQDKSYQYKLFNEEKKSYLLRVGIEIGGTFTYGGDIYLKSKEEAISYGSQYINSDLQGLLAPTNFYHTVPRYK